MDTLTISPHLEIPLSEIQFQAIKAAGPGGQHVNKTSSAIHLRFDVRGSSMSETQKARVLAFRDSRISDSGVIVIKVGQSRSQERNKMVALERLQELLQKALKRQKKRRPTKPSRSAVQKRLKKKAERSATKSKRGRVRDFD